MVANYDPEGVAFEYEVIDGWPTFQVENISSSLLKNPLATEGA